MSCNMRRMCWSDLQHKLQSVMPGNPCEPLCQVNKHSAWLSLAARINQLYIPLLIPSAAGCLQLTHTRASHIPVPTSHRVWE